MTDELRREHNGRVEGKQVCPECVIMDFYHKYGL